MSSTMTIERPEGSSPEAAMLTDSSDEGRMTAGVECDPNGRLGLLVDRIVDHVWTYQDHPEDQPVSLSDVESVGRPSKLDAAQGLEAIGILRLSYSDAYVSASLTEAGYDLAEDVARSDDSLEVTVERVREALERPHPRFTFEVQEYLCGLEEGEIRIADLTKELTKNRKNEVTTFRVHQSIDVLRQLGVVEVEATKRGNDWTRGTVRLREPDPR